jgi:hypothetical protein
MMLSDCPVPVFSLTSEPPSMVGTTHLSTLLLDSSKHVALFFIGDTMVHRPQPLFEKFATICKRYQTNLRPVIVAQAHRIGGLRRPEWSNEDILFLGTKTSRTERVYGLNGNEMGVLIVRPDGYIGFSIPIDRQGNAFNQIDSFLFSILLEG